MFNDWQNQFTNISPAKSVFYCGFNGRNQKQCVVPHHKELLNTYLALGSFFFAALFVIMRFLTTSALHSIPKWLWCTDEQKFPSVLGAKRYSLNLSAVCDWKSLITSILEKDPRYMQCRSLDCYTTCTVV